MTPRSFAPPFEEVLVGGVIGSGGTSRVFSCRCASAAGAPPLALKAMRHEYRGRPDVVRMFRNEADKLARFAHPRVPRFLAYAEREGSAELLMSRIEGVSLQSLIEGRSPLVSSADFAARCRRELRDVVEALEAAGLVHGDLSPKNVMVDPDGRCFVIDFALCFDRQDGPPFPELAREPAFAPGRDDRHALETIQRLLAVT